eukprot:TRINITY_DN42119_c0_g1_i1.p1 TRINITY_DN42119_c0_g1~~TRINITY_DN42119_c0_g1_i1.p1  ORF type:complete len:434 (+),score=58.22 TRINITY_DN42119_c0_g1_i1:59-1303(+)
MAIARFVGTAFLDTAPVDTHDRTETVAFSSHDFCCGLDGYSELPSGCTVGSMLKRGVSVLSAFMCGPSDETTAENPSRCVRGSPRGNMSALDFSAKLPPLLAAKRLKTMAPFSQAASSFLSLRSSEFESGGALPSRAYSRCLMGGEGQIPEFSVDDLPPGTQYLMLTAEDIDAPHGADLLWAKVNISPLAAGGVSTTARGLTVVPFHGPNIQDEFLHRIVFRAFALEERLAGRDLESPEAVRHALSPSPGPPTMEGKGQNWEEMMAIAVAKLRRSNPAQDCDAPVAPPQNLAQQRRAPKVQADIVATRSHSHREQNFEASSVDNGRAGARNSRDMQRSISAIQPGKSSSNIRPGSEQTVGQESQQAFGGDSYRENVDVLDRQQAVEERALAEGHALWMEFHRLPLKVLHGPSIE